MKILVIDDKSENLKSAKEMLGVHDLTFAMTFDKAMECFQEKINEEKLHSILSDKGIEEPTKKKYGEDYTKHLFAYCDAVDDATKEAIIPLEYDVVLTDMFMPMSPNMIYKEIYNPRTLVPYGLILAIKAALLGAKYVALVTDTNHHNHAMSAALDYIDSYHKGHNIAGKKLFINRAKVMFAHAEMIKNSDGIFVKNWSHVLDELTSK